MAKKSQTRKPSKKAANPATPEKRGRVPVRVAKPTGNAIPRKAAARPPVKHSSITGDLGVVFIIGDGQLVREYAELCSVRGLKAIVKWSGTAELSQGDRKFKIAATPPQGTSFALELTNLDVNSKRENVQWLERTLPADCLILSSSVIVSATEQASWISDRSRLVGFGALPTLSARPLVEVAPTIYSPATAVESAARLFRTLGKEIEIVQDRVGLVFPRVICRMINEAAFALAEEVSTPQDMDAAVRLGLNHPRGPIEWTDRIGLSQVAAVLGALERETGDPRYRIAPLLRQMALAGEWWKR